jgi:23S rRNA (guanosine2251-2'-O)-methyltransferase
MLEAKASGSGRAAAAWFAVTIITSGAMQSPSDHLCHKILASITLCRNYFTPAPHRTMVRPGFFKDRSAFVSTSFRNRGKRGNDPARRPERRGGHGGDVLRIYGLHAVEAALANPKRRVIAVYATPNATQRLDLKPVAGRLLHSLTPRDLDRMLGADTVHQGVMIEAEPLAEPGIADLEHARFIVLLDQVTDPHNVGAILRSAAVFGVEALVMTARNSPPLHGALAKAASGGLEHVPVVLAPNLSRALAELGEMGFTRVGLDAGGSQELEDLPAPEKLALVLGAEDHGLRRLTGENCDAICALATAGPLHSLNVSNAAAIAFHAAFLKMRSRPGR